MTVTINILVEYRNQPLCGVNVCSSQSRVNSKNFQVDSFYLVLLNLFSIGKKLRCQNRFKFEEYSFNYQIRNHCWIIFTAKVCFKTSIDQTVNNFVNNVNKSLLNRTVAIILLFKPWFTNKKKIILWKNSDWITRKRCENMAKVEWRFHLREKKSRNPN